MKKSILDIIEETTDDAMPKEKKKKCENCDADANESGFCGKCEVDERASQVGESSTDYEGFIKCPKCHGEGEYEIGDSFGSYVCDECNGDQIIPRRNKSDAPLQRLRDFFPVRKPCENCGNGPVTRDGLCKDC